MKTNYDDVVNLDQHDWESIMGKDIILSDWKQDINDLKVEIKTQEMLVEFFKGEMFRLIRLCAENGIDAKHPSS